MNKNYNYVRGRRKEYKIMKELKKEGFNIVARTAGSHSPIDVIAIRKKPKVILLIQSKPKGFSKNKKRAIENEFNWVNDKFLTKFKII